MKSEVVRLGVQASISEDTHTHPYYRHSGRPGQWFSGCNLRTSIITITSGLVRNVTILG